MTAETPAGARPTPDERIMAALSHASIILPMTGLIVPVLIWVTQKAKSTYVSFQSVQSIAYHIVLILFGFLGGICYGCSFFGAFFPFVLSGPGSDSGGPPPFFFLPFGVIGLFFLGYFALMIYGIVGAVLTLQGKDFKYLVVGERVERFLQQK
jgi:hypothetical protein